MTTSHLTLDGAWAECSKPEECELLFHVPGMTPAAAEALPASMLDPLLEVVDPPNATRSPQAGEDTGPGKFWVRYDPERGKNVLHRAYGLPAAKFGSGERQWWVNGRRHRGGGKPAQIKAYGAQEWWVDGCQHRDGDKPAQVSKLGEIWMVHGKQHRAGDKPAVIRRDEHGVEIARAWFHQDFEHRLFAPAVVYANGGREWWRLGHMHRLFGPAVVLADGTREWWLFGRQVWPRPKPWSDAKRLDSRQWSED
jgi:hypothetical protein